MKKVKLTTVTLAMLAGTVVAPIMSNAEETQAELLSAFTAQTEEVQPEAAAEEAAAEEVNTDAAPAQAAPASAAAAAIEPGNPGYTKELRERKISAKAEVDSLYHEGLSWEECLAFDARIDAAVTVGQIDGIVAEAKAQTASNVQLADAKAKAKADINALYQGGLSWDIAGPLSDRVDNAKTVAEVNGIVAEANNAEQVRVAKQEASAAIYDMAAGDLGLTLEQRDAYLVEIANAETLDAVNAVVPKAEAQVTLNKAIRNAELELTELVNTSKIGWDEYYVFLEEARAAKTPEEAAAVVVKAENAATLIEAKEKATNDIWALTLKGDLTDDEYQTFLKQINEADSIEAVNAVVESANYFVSVKAAVEAAKTDLNNLVHDRNMTTGAYWDYVAELEAAKTLEEVDAVVAKAVYSLDLRDAKEVAALEISDMYGDQQINLGDNFFYQEVVTNAEDLETVEGAVQGAKDLTAARKAAKSELLGFIAEGLIDEAKFDSVTDAIAGVHTAPEVEAIMSALRVELGLETPGEVDPGETDPGETDPGEGEKPETPGEDGEKPETPGEDGEKPETPGEDGEKPETPDEDGEKPETPGEDGEKPETPDEDGKDNTKPSDKDDKKPADKGNTNTDPAKKVVKKVANNGKTLPQTGEKANAGLIAGGLMSMLTGAFVFFKRNK